MEAAIPERSHMKNLFVPIYPPVQPPRDPHSSEHSRAVVDAIPVYINHPTMTEAEIDHAVAQEFAA